MHINHAREQNSSRVCPAQDLYPKFYPTLVPVYTMTRTQTVFGSHNQCLGNLRLTAQRTSITINLHIHVKQNS